MKRTTCKIFSDASFDEKTGKCGYGVAIVMKGLCILKYGSIRGAKSSSEAEVLATKKAIDYLSTKEFMSFGRDVRKVAVLSDSFTVASISGYKDSSPWKNSVKESKVRLKKMTDAIIDACSRYEYGLETFHIRGHQEMMRLPEEEAGMENKILEYKFNRWCDQSARKNLRYGLHGKIIIQAPYGFPDPENYSVFVPEGARVEKNKNS